MSYHELPGETPETFFDALFNRDDVVLVSESCAIGLFDLRTKLASFVTDTAKTAKIINATDVYFSVTLQDPAGVQRVARKRGQKRPRWYAETARYIGALWLDIDVATGAHQKKGLFPSEEAALKFLYETLAIPPSFVVRTGGGFHAYWIFDVPIPVTDSNKDVALPQAWQDYCRHEASELGYEMDATHDLARMLRVPCTLNGKYQTNEAGCDNVVRCLARDDVPSLGCAPTYTPDDFEILVGQRREEIEYTSSETPSVPFTVGPVGGLDVSCTPFRSAPPIVESLCATSADFCAVWQREVTHLPSQSEYDLSIATWLAKFDAADADIVAALVVHRRDAGLEPKSREDYYARTIAKARKDGIEDPSEYAARIERADKEAANRLAEDAGSVGGSDAPRSTGNTIADVNQLLGDQVEIKRVIRYPGDPPTFTLETTRGVLTAGDGSVILSPTKARSLFANAASVVIKRYRGAAWDAIAQAIFNAAEDVALGEASHPAAELAEHIEGYLDTTRPGKDRDDALSGRLPWLEGTSGVVWGSISDFRRWLHTGGQRVSGPEVARRLRELGSEPRTIMYNQQRGTHSGKRASASYWRLSGLKVPQDLASPERAREG